ncbi:MAG TPA: hypothetical protein VH165_14070 [Kofleriaceae bacterium]|nr:hypothetical protein [Kofleriaceae bacterium]
MTDVRRATRFTTAALAAWALAGALGAAGCVDGFQGANVQIDLSPGTPVQAHVGSPMMGTELPANAHFSLYAIRQGMAQDELFEVQQFEVHRIVDPTSPCFIDVGDHVPHPGLHVTQYAARTAQDTGILDVANPPATATDVQKIELATALQRMVNVGELASDTGVRAVTSASTAIYPAVAADCNGSSDQIPPPTCMDDASNTRRLALCQKAWAADDGLWEGSDRVLTVPLHGETHGLVDGLNPINMAPVGGAQFFVQNALENIDAYAIYTQVDGMPDPGTQLLFGKPVMTTRGVLHVHLVSPLNSLLTAEMAIFADLGQDNVHF